MPERDLLAEHRHAETLEKLHRLAVALELLNSTAERQLRAIVDLGAKTESGLRYAISAWQQTRQQGAAANHNREG
jgi:hypothetical protein